MYFWLWIAILIGSVILETITPSALICIWFAPSSLIALILNQLNVSFTIQVIVFFLSTLLLLLIFRPIAKNYLRGNIIRTNADRVLGQITKLNKTIDEDNYGEVKINGVIWNAISKEGKTIKEGSKVKILAIDGTKLIVEEI